MKESGEEIEVDDKPAESSPVERCEYSVMILGMAMIAAT